MSEKEGGQSGTSGTFWGVCKAEKNSVCCFKSAFGMAEKLPKCPRSLYHSYKECERLQQSNTRLPTDHQQQPTTMNSETTTFPFMNCCQPIWKIGKVDGFSRYTICGDGNVINDKKKTALKGSLKSTNGYKQYKLLNDDGKQKMMLCHRLVALAFIPNPEQKQMVDHIDRNKFNNHISNLRWSTNSENQINTPMRKRKNEGDGYRHITQETVCGNQYYRIQIKRRGKHILNKPCRKDEYTLEQVVHIRNEFYKKHDIKIEDE